MRYKFNFDERKLGEIFQFLVIFTFLSSIMHFLIWLNIDTVYLQNLMASLISSLLFLSGIPAYSDGINVIISNFGIVRIIKDCLGWKSMLALTSLIVATPKVDRSYKINGILLGILIIIFLNILRLFSTIFIVYKFNISFDFIHSILWQWSLVVAILFIWIAWLNIYRNFKSGWRTFQKVNKG